MVKSLELRPIDGRKSFYGKAKVVYVNESCFYLVSYDTTVCSLFPHTMQFVRWWDGYSSTTLRHVNAFRQKYGLPTLSKSEWLAIPIKIPV